MAALVSLAQAKAHLRIDSDAANTDVQFKVEQASAIILAYLAATVDPGWTVDTAPVNVQSAVLLMLGHLYEHRGDNMAPDAETWAAIRTLLVTLKTPAVA